MTSPPPRSGTQHGFGEPRASFDEYHDQYQHARMTRHDGVLELELHTDGHSLVWGDGPHSELGHCFHDIGSDPENRVIILTGVEEEFCAQLDESWRQEMTPELWGRIYSNGTRLLSALLGVECPMIAAVNGPARVHAELAVLCDIVIASETAYFQDAPHFRFGTVPGDGVQAVWSGLLGPNRGRAFLLLGQRLSADEACRLGVVAEVVTAGDLRARAQEIAADLARQPTATLRYTRAVLNAELRGRVQDATTRGLALEGLGAFAHWFGETR